MRFWGDDSEIDIQPRTGKAEFDRWSWRDMSELTGAHCRLQAAGLPSRRRAICISCANLKLKAICALRRRPIRAPLLAMPIWSSTLVCPSASSRARFRRSTTAPNYQSGQPFDPAEYERIKELWLDHIAAEHAGDIPGLLATLTEDCVYTMLNNGKTWHGHEGAAKFYDGFLTGFPENCFAVTNVFIGPQGVVEEAHFNGVHQRRPPGPALDRPAD